MAHYLRDERVSNITISEDRLVQLSGVFAARVNTLNESVPEENEKEKAFLTYIIRIDNKGYRIFSIDELLRYFRLGKEVERVLFVVETGQSLLTSRQFGTYLELRLDEKDITNCYLAVSSDNKDWADASFSAVHDVLSKCKNKNGWARTAWTQSGVQLIGVSLGFILSLWIASKIAPRLSIENPFVFAFLFVLLIFSNVWSFISQKILWTLNVAFPNLKFYRPNKERLHWLMQAVVGSIVFAIVVFVLSQAFSFLMDILGSLVNKNT